MQKIYRHFSESTNNCTKGRSNNENIVVGGRSNNFLILCIEMFWEFISKIEINDQITKTLKFANSPVYRTIENKKEMNSGYKRVAWPPVSEERIIKEFTPQPTSQTTVGCTGATYPQTNQLPYHQHYLQYELQHDRPYHQTSHPLQYKQLSNTQAPIYNNEQLTTLQNPSYQHQHQGYQSHQMYTPSQQYQESNQKQSTIQDKQRYNPTQWHELEPSSLMPGWKCIQSPIDNIRNQCHNIRGSDPNNSVYPSAQEKPHQPQQSQYQQPPSSQDTTDYQQQFEEYRGSSSGIIKLRKEVPITQKATPIYTSQPAAVSFEGGTNMRGDLKWPPPEYKEAAARENEERRKLALGPVCRPRKVHRDYTIFFAKNATNCYYPSYKVPPGTQHTYA